MSASLHGDVASAIGQQVEQMILQAKKDSENRVRHDLNVARNQLQHMEGLITDLHERVGRCARANGPGAPDPSQTVDRTFLTQKIQQLEQKWGSEVKALKQDLHRTILAHNHNSDLMRHHRDALDEARRKLDAQTQPNAEKVDAQIEKVERMLRQGQLKQRALEQMTQRLTELEQQVGEILPNAAPMPSPFPAMMPGLPGMNPMMAQPPMAGQQREAAPKRQTKKEGEVTDEELRARLLQGAQRPANNASDGASNFNAEAPVFVPRGASSTPEVKDNNDSDGGGEKKQGAAAAGAAAGEEVEAPAVAVAEAPAPAAPEAPVEAEPAAEGAATEAAETPAA